MSREKLDVFLSSDQKEFENERRELSKTICDIPFLNCIPLERRGADTRDALEASIRAVKKCDFYVGIFGHEYSETTIKEYNEAVKRRKPCLTYVRKVKERDARLARFIDEELKNRFKYHPFRGKKNLYNQVEADLRRLILEILRVGLEARKQSKEEAQRLVAEEMKMPPTRPAVKEPLRAAETAFNIGSYLESLIRTTTALELALKEELRKKNVDVKGKTLGFLINSAARDGIIDQSETGLMREISYIRNAALHDGETPDKKKTTWVLETAKSILKKLHMSDLVHALTTYRRRKDGDTWHWCKNCSNYPSNPDDLTVTKTGKERPSFGELCNECRAKEKAGTC